MLNTISFSIVKLNDPIDPKKIARIAKFTKEDALKIFRKLQPPKL